MDVHALHVALNALDFWALFGCNGLLIARLWLLPASAFNGSIGLRWHRSLGVGLAVLTAAGPALFLARATEMAGVSLADIGPLLPQVLAQSHFGHVWEVHFGALAAMWLGWGVSRRTSAPGTALMLLAAAVLAFTFSAVSHAADAGDFRPPEINDWLHVLAAGAWGGGILGALAFIFPALRRLPEQRRRALMAEAARRLSALSAYALLAVVLTGLLNAALRLGDFGTLTTTVYGRTLAVKLLLVGLMALIGAANRFVLVPKLRDADASAQPPGRAAGRLRTSLLIDALLVLLALLVTSVLIQGMPPASMPGMRAAPGMGMPGM